MRSARAAGVLALLAAIACAPVVSPAQEARPAGETQPGPARRVRIDLSVLPGATVSETDALALYNTLVAALVAGAPAIQVVEPAAPAASAAERSTLALRQGADAWIWVGVRSEAGGYRMSVRTLDLRSGESAPQLDIRTGGLDHPERLWPPVVEAVQSRFARPAAPPAALPHAGELQLRAAPGTRIGGLPAGTLVVGPGGEAAVTVEAPATYRITASHPRYYPVSRAFYVQDLPMTLDLHQKPIGSWAVQLALSKLAYPSFALMYVSVPERYFAAAGWTSYTTGVPLWDDPEKTRLPLNEVWVSGGLYVGSGLFAGALRPFVSARAFVRLLNKDDGGWLGIELEPQSRVGFGLGAGIEAAGHPIVRPFVEAIPQAYLLQDRDLIRQYYDTLDLFGRSIPHYFYVGPFLVDPFQFQAGVRIRL